MEYGNTSSLLLFVDHKEKYKTNNKNKASPIHIYEGFPQFECFLHLGLSIPIKLQGDIYMSAFEFLFLKLDLNSILEIAQNESHL